MERDEEEEGGENDGRDKSEALLSCFFMNGGRVSERGAGLGGLSRVLTSMELLQGCITNYSDPPTLSFCSGFRTSLLDYSRAAALCCIRFHIALPL